MPILTDQLIAKTKAKSRDFYIWDEKITGFGVRISYTGRKTYVLQWRDKEKNHAISRRKIAAVEEISVEKARTLAQQIKQQVLHVNEKQMALSSSAKSTKNDSKLFTIKTDANNHNQNDTEKDNLDTHFEDVLHWLDGSAHFTKSGLRNKKNSVRSKIIGVASSIFLEQGYDANVDLIAASAGLTKTTIYKYFKNKEDLFRASVAEMAMHVMPEIKLSDYPNFRDALFAFGKGFRDGVLSSELLAMYRLTIGDLCHFPEIQSNVFELGSDRVVAVLAKYIQEEINKGTIKKIDAKISAEHFISACLGLERTRRLMGLRRYSGAKEKAYLEQVVDMFVTSIEA